MFADKNAPFMFGAYAIFLGGMLFYVISLLTRARAATRDEKRLDELEEFLKRDVYVTLGDPPLEEDNAEVLPGPPAESPEADAAAVQKVTEQVMTVNATIAEEDLLPLPPPGESKAYWKQVSDLISRNWSRQIRSIRRAPSSETVRVHFKMYASGVAQLIQLEKGSGARDVNEAGLQTIIHAREKRLLLLPEQQEA